MRWLVPLVAVLLILAPAAAEQHANEPPSEPTPEPSQEPPSGPTHVPPGAAAGGELGDGIEFVVGGEPGVSVSVNGIDVKAADAPRHSLPLDPRAPANLSVRLAPPPGQWWNLTGFKVGLMVSGPGSSPPDALSRLSPSESEIPPGVTVFVNRTIDLTALESIGAGVFLMRVEAVERDAGIVYAQEFYVHVTGNPLLTVAGVAVTALSVATGYGLWRLVSDLKEFVDTYRRHRRRVAEAKRRAKGVVGAALAVHHEAERIERTRFLRWTATGLGLGAVLLSWAAFFGYVAFDAMGIVVGALETGTIFLGVALVLAAVKRRIEAFRRRHVVRSLTPTGPEPLAGAAPAPEAPLPPPPRPPGG